MMKKLSGVLFVLAAGILGLALMTSAAGTTARAPKSQRLEVSPLEALALDGSRVAYDVAATRTRSHGKLVRHPNRVFIWSLHTDKTINVSGKRGTHADTHSSPATSFEQLAIAGTRVAWLTTSRFDSPKGEDDLYISSVLRPKVRRVSDEVRYGQDCGKMVHDSGCTGDYLGPLVGAGNLIAVNRSTFTVGSWPQITDGRLYVVNGTKLTQIARGGDTVWATDTDGGRVAVLRDAQVYAEETVGLYSSTGASLISVTPTSSPGAVAISGPNLVVFGGSKLAVYDASSGSLKRTFAQQGKSIGPGDAQGNIAVYATGRSMHALNLSSGKDRIVGRLPHSISLARIDSVGLVYTDATAMGRRPIAGPIVFLPFKQVAAAVS